MSIVFVTFLILSQPRAEDYARSRRRKRRRCSSQRAEHLRQNFSVDSTIVRVVQSERSCFAGSLMKAISEIRQQRTREARGEKTRQDILQAAVHIASAEGLEGLTIGRLADELRLSKSGLFAHFGSKEELQLAVVGKARDIFVREVVDRAFKRERGLVRLLAMLDEWLAYVGRSAFRCGCFFMASATVSDSR